MATTRTNDFDPDEIYAKMPWLKSLVTRVCDPDTGAGEERAILAHLDKNLLADVFLLPVMPSYHLSEGEKQVLRRVLAGEGETEIAENLGKGKQTVKTQLQRARSKIGTKKVWQAAIAAYLVGDLT